MEYALCKCFMEFVDFWMTTCFGVSDMIYNEEQCELMDFIYLQSVHLFCEWRMWFVNSEPKCCVSIYGRSKEVELPIIFREQV